MQSARTHHYNELTKFEWFNRMPLFQQLRLWKFFPPWYSTIDCEWFYCKVEVLRNNSNSAVKGQTIKTILNISTKTCATLWHGFPGWVLPLGKMWRQPQNFYPSSPCSSSVIQVMVVRARKETDWTSLSFVKTFSPLSSELKEHLVLEVKCLHVESLSFQAT